MDVVIHGWEFRLKTEMHDRLGKVFVVATPDECSIWSVGILEFRVTISAGN